MVTKEDWRKRLAPYHKPDNFKSITQLLTTLLPYSLLWVLYKKTAPLSLMAYIPMAILMSLFLLRAFTLMHDCGHRSLFNSKRANQLVGFFLGVLTGMPQYVWSKHHAYHHATNGNWEKYQGPLSIVTKEKFDAMSLKQQRKYLIFRHPLPVFCVGGFIYALFNPRFNWLKGSWGLIRHIYKSKKHSPELSFYQLVESFDTRLWKTPKEYAHMTYNNLVLLVLWSLMSYWLGIAHFLLLYLLSGSFAASVGLILFTVQHNFEGAYASDTDKWDYVKGALEGSSFLILPKFLNWFTADIAYHHIHHLSSAIPNYHLKAVHTEYCADLKHVKRIRLTQIFSAFKCILWDKEKNMIVAPTKESKSKSTVKAS
jgi:acyl-lipid omega-6 desaturase (Delta-12 desaturase)